jgi:hypothetical protein
MSQAADKISTGDFNEPEFNEKGKDEVAVLGSSFNRMRRSLEKAMQMIDSEPAPARSWLIRLSPNPRRTPAAAVRFRVATGCWNTRSSGPLGGGGFGITYLARTST